MILNVIMIFIACCAAGAWLVTWAKLDEQKKLTNEERDRRWDEISRAVGLENELEQSKAREKCSAQSVLWYAEQLTKAEQDLKRYTFWFESCRNGNMILQDKLSAIICPTNNHVWRDGVCAKCGRVKDA